MLDRFIEILSLQAESKEQKRQKEIAYHVLNMYNRLGLPSLIVEEDTENNNFYITKSTPPTGQYYPCVVAHLDQVHYTKAWYRIFQDDDVLFAMGKTKDGDYVQVGTGSDDLSGVWMLLELLISQPYLKACLFSDEEIGCVGSKKAKSDFFKDCSFVMQADRRGNSKDFIIYTNGTDVSSKEFQEGAKPYIEKYGYKTGYGSSTDVGQLVKNGIGISTVNLSCGYFKPHSDRETSSISDSFICLNLMKDMATNMTHTRWEFTPPPPKTYLPAATSNAYKRNSNTYPSSRGAVDDWRDWEDMDWGTYGNANKSINYDPNKDVLDKKNNSSAEKSKAMFNINKDNFVLDIEGWPYDINQAIRSYLSSRGFTFAGGKSLLSEDIGRQMNLSRSKLLYCNNLSKKCIPLISKESSGVKDILKSCTSISYTVFYETFVVYSLNKGTTKQKTLFRVDVDQDIYTCPFCLNVYSLRQHPTEESSIYCSRKCKGEDFKFRKMDLNVYRHNNGHYMVNRSEVEKAFS